MPWLAQKPAAGGPRGLTVEVTSHCGYDCAPCPLNFYTEQVPRQHAPAARIEKAIAEAAPLDVVDFTGWGEALLHPSLIQLISCASGAAPQVTLTTAGSLLTEEKSRALVGAGLTYLMISLDAAAAESYRTLKHKDEFGLVVENARRFVAVREEAKRPGSSPRPRLALSFIVMRENVEEAPAFARLAASVGADQIVFKTAVPFAKEELSRSVDSHYYKEVPAGFSEKARALVGKATRIATDAGVEVARFGDFKSAAPHRCMAYAEGRPFLRADGALSPCCMLAYPLWRVGPGGAARKMAPVFYGSLEEKPLAQLWNAEPYRSFRAGLDAGGAARPSECADCPIGCNFALEVTAPAAQKRAATGTR